MFWLLGLVIFSTSVFGEESCLSADENPYLLFGTKTAYIFGNNALPVNRVHEVLGCQPQAFWLLSRPGSHNPENREIGELQKLADLKKNISANYRSGNLVSNQRMCTADLNLLERWDWNPRQNVTFAGDLTSEGYLTTQQLAQTWRQRYPAILTSNQHDYKFKFVNDQRSTTTFKAFTEGLFKDQAEGYDIPKEHDDKLLKPVESCPQWKKMISDNKDTLTQRKLFESKAEFKEMVANVSHRLGFNYSLEETTVLYIYEMCRYNKAWNVAQISPWCAAFTKKDLKQLEYAEDLETYYKYGYGNAEYSKLGCPLIKDMMDFLKMHAAPADTPLQPRAQILFGEAAALLATTSVLDARRDAEPLTTDGHSTAGAQARKWASSTVTPFNANLAAVLYKCDPNANFQIKEPYQVLFLQNEQEMYLEGCRVGLCDWSLVKSRYGDIADKCDLNYCNSSGRRDASFTVIGIAVTAAVFRIIW